MDFSLPREAEEFRAELRNWLTANLTDDIVNAGRRGAADPEAYQTIQAWSRARGACAP